jgi:sterol desaturase/sphingolipid hydroxylase (fatty acid hydroxylase superfamily)
MPGIASLLVLASAAIVLVLGALHLLYTFRGSKLDPRDAATRQAMEQSPLRITRETTMWRAWIGFNATHSLGLLLFAVIYGYLALAAPGLLFGSMFLLGVGLVMLASYVFLARSYFFSVPFRGVALATAFYVAGLAVAA